MPAQMQWVWSSSQLLNVGPLWCTACRTVKETGALTPHGLMCRDCHDQIVKTVMVQMTWNYITHEATFFWEGIGGGVMALINGSWHATGKGFEAEHSNWYEAVVQWGRLAGYLGPDPFTRDDYAAFITTATAVEVDTEEPAEPDQEMALPS